jgi:hypothetical protein
VAIALGTVATASFMTRVWVLIGLSVLMTVGVYGLVAGIVKLDDIGEWLIRRAGDGGGAAAKLQRALGLGIVLSAPWLMKFLSVAGTVAMFLVGGGILAHGIPGTHDLLQHWSEEAAVVPVVGAPLAAVLHTLANLLVGVLAGSRIQAVVVLVNSQRSGAQVAPHRTRLMASVALRRPGASTTYESAQGLARLGLDAEIEEVLVELRADQVLRRQVDDGAFFAEQHLAGGLHPAEQQAVANGVRERQEVVISGGDSRKFSQHEVQLLDRVACDRRGVTAWLDPALVKASDLGFVHATLLLLCAPCSASTRPPRKCWSWAATF